MAETELDCSLSAAATNMYSAAKFLPIYLALFLATCQTANSTPDLNEIGEVMTKCKQKFPVTPEDYAGKEVSRKAKCFLDCFAQDFPNKQEYSGMGQLILEAMNGTMPEEYTSEVSRQFATCVGDVRKNVKDKCEASYQSYSCIFRTLEKVILFAILLA